MSLGGGALAKAKKHTKKTQGWYAVGNIVHCWKHSNDAVAIHGWVSVSLHTPSKEWCCENSCALFMGHAVRMHTLNWQAHSGADEERLATLEWGQRAGMQHNTQQASAQRIDRMCGTGKQEWGGDMVQCGGQKEIVGVEWVCGACSWQVGMGRCPLAGDGPQAGGWKSAHRRLRRVD